MSYEEELESISDDLREIFLEMGREARAALESRGFDYSDKLVSDLTGRAVAAYDTVVLAVLPERCLEIIKSPLLWLVDDPLGGDKKISVIPCADADQVRRIALEYGDERARRKFTGR
jgi:hypothetical protein